MSYQFMNIEITDGVGTIWLNRPPANSLNGEVVEELAQAFAELRDNDEAKVLVIASKIPGFFVAGADIKMFAEMTPDQAWEISARLQEVNQMLEDMPKISIAVISGYALGGGLELALACDFRFMAESVTIKDKERTPTLGLPETTMCRFGFFACRQSAYFGQGFLHPQTGTGLYASGRNEKVGILILQGRQGNSAYFVQRLFRRQIALVPRCGDAGKGPDGNAAHFRFAGVGGLEERGEDGWIRLLFIA